MPGKMLDGLVIRDAVPADAPFIAWALAEAFDADQTLYDRYLSVCEQPDTLYSWSRTRVAEIDGRVVGCQVTFTGEDYAILRKRSWLPIWGPRLTEEMIDSAPLEADPDEYHLDSIAVLPEYRGLGIARTLIMDSVHRGQSLGYRKIGLLSALRESASHDRALHDCALHDYYLRLGFVDEKPIRLFLTDYIKMRLE